MTAILGRGSTEWTLDDSRFQKGVTRVMQTMAKLQARAEVVGRIARNMLLIGGAALAGFIKVASDATEIASKFEAVFRDGADAANEFAVTLAKSVGRSKTDIQEALSTFQGFFVGLGFGSDAARKFSQELTALGIDFASFNNLADDEAIGRFISALSGSGEVLDRFGINIKQAALGLKLLEQGIKGGVTKANEQQKAIARLAIIMEAMTDQGAVGDAVRTADQFANRLRRLKGVVKDASVEIGNIFIPAVTESVKKVQELIPRIEEWVKKNQDAVIANTVLAAKVGLVLVVLPKLIAFLRTLIPLLTSARTAALGLAGAFAALIPLALLSQLSRINTEIERMKRGMREATQFANEFNAAITAGNKAKALGDLTAQLKAIRQQEKSLNEELEKRVNTLIRLDEKQRLAEGLRKREARGRRGGALLAGFVAPPGAAERERAQEIENLAGSLGGMRSALKALQNEIEKLEAETEKLNKAPGGLGGATAGAAGKPRGLPTGQFLGPQALFKAIQQRVSGIDREAQALKAAQDTSKNTKSTADSGSKTVALLESVDAALRGGIGAVFT